MTLDRTNETLDELDTEQRIKQLLPLWCRHDSAQSLVDLKASVSVKASEELRELDRTIVFLTRYARLDPEYVERQDLERVRGFLAITNDWISAENGKRSSGNPEDMSDDGQDF